VAEFTLDAAGRVLKTDFSNLLPRLPETYDSSLKREARAMGTEPLAAHTSFPVVRRWPRYKLNVPVRVISQKETKTVITSGRGTELNGGGLSAFAGVELSVDEVVEVEFTPPYSGEPIRVTCTIRNRQDYNYGLEFHMESEDEIERVSMIRAIFMGMGSRIS
jgi:PilZ domain